MGMKENVSTAREFERILYLDELLRAGKHFTARSILGEYRHRFGVQSDRTVKEDINKMRTYFNAPVAWNSAKNTYYYSDETFFLPSVLLNDADIFGLLLAEQVLEQYENSPIFDTLDRAMAKLHDLIAVVSESSRVEPLWFKNKITVISPPLSFINEDFWATILSALRGNHRLNMRYRRNDGKNIERTVEPYNLINYRGAWYLICRLPEDGYKADAYPYRTYHLSRIQSLEADSVRFHRDRSFRLDDHIDPELGISVSPDWETIEVQFTADIAYHIRERSWHSSARITDLDDGDVQLTFRTNQIYGAFLVLLPFLNFGTGDRSAATAGNGSMVQGWSY